MLEIWGRPYSSNVIPVIWAAAETGIPWQLKLAGGSFGQLDTDAYAAMNPNRLIPCIRDGDFALWESNAIIRYLAACYGRGRLWPEDPRQCAVADQWMEWCQTRAFPPVIQAFFATVRTDPGKRDPARIVAHADEAAKILSILDAHLAGRDYLLGEGFSMADIPLGCVAYRYFHLDIPRPALPNMEAWYARLCERPAYQQHVMRFFGTTPDDWAALERASANEGA